MKLQEVRESALALPLRSRKKLVQELAESVLSEEELGNISAEWKKEIERRMEAHERGEAKTVPGEKVIAWLRKRMK
jgi:putative addiction module component (TIGR02574 family)